MALGVRGFIPDRETVVSGTPVALSASLFGYGSAVDGMATASTIAYDMSMEMPDIVVGEPSLELVFLNRSVIDPAEPGFVSGGERVVYYWQLEHTEASTWPAMSLSLFDANLESISGGGLYSAVSLRVIFPSWEEEWLYEQDEGGDVSVVWSHDRPTEGVTCARNVSVGGTVGNGDPLWKQSECSNRKELAINSVATFEYVVEVIPTIGIGWDVFPQPTVSYRSIALSADDRYFSCDRVLFTPDENPQLWALAVPLPEVEVALNNPLADPEWNDRDERHFSVCQTFSLASSIAITGGEVRNLTSSLLFNTSTELYFSSLSIETLMAFKCPTSGRAELSQDSNWTYLASAPPTF